jgi:hypothetical protein
MKAETIASALGGRRAGGGWMARCPSHDDREPSLSIHHAADGKVLVCCHAGCEQRRVIAALRSRGLCNSDNRHQFTRPLSWTTTTQKADRDNSKRAEAAIAIWQETVPTEGTLVETYFSSRGLQRPPPMRMRFHTRLKHPSGGLWPAMVALVTRGVDDTPIAIHRTFLARNGTRKAPVEPQKMMLGPCRGGAVRLAEVSDLLMVGEGVETTLSAMQATGLAGWAALSSSGLKALVLPPAVRSVIILADRDRNGAGEHAAHVAAERWVTEGRQVRIAMPADPDTDFADMLVGRSPKTTKKVTDVAA